MADSLEELRARLNGDSPAIPQPQGPYPTPQAQPPEPEIQGFDAADVWHFPYNFRSYAPKGKEIKGEVPAPTQARIDDFRRAMSRLAIEQLNAAREAEKALAEAEAAQAAEGGEATDAPADEQDLSVEELMEAVEEAMAEKEKVLDRIRDAVAKFCANHPTRKQLDYLPENALNHFVNVIGSKIRPEG